MATRVVIVEFAPEVTVQDIVEFEGWLRALAAITPGLARMTCGGHSDAKGEAELSAHAPNAIFGNFVSVWEFDNERALDEFVMHPIHREMARDKFRKFVSRRYIANVR